MKKIIIRVLSIIFAFTSVLSFTACNNNSDSDTSEPVSSDNTEFMAEAQGIRILSSCRMNPRTEGASMSGTDDIAGIVVQNSTDKTLQYAEITASFSDGVTHLYKVSTIPPGEVCFVAEENNYSYRELTTGFFGFEIYNIVFFTEEPSVHSDKFEFSGADGILNIKNISGNDISDRIIVYYKDYDNSRLSDGKTYRVTIEDGVKAGEIKQVRASHFRQGGSMIMFVQIVQSEVE